jgi:hypothetical protein
MREYNSMVARIERMSLSQAEKGELRRQALHYQRQIARLARASAAANPHHTKALAFRVLGSMSAKMSALLRSLGTEEVEGTTMTTLTALARELTAQSAGSEPVRPFYKRKPAGGRRPIVEFGHKRRAFQVICSDVIRVTSPVFEREYLRSSRGPERLVLDLLGLLHTGGLAYVVTTDIKNCYGSINKEVLHQRLQLPKWAIDTIITIDDHAELNLQGISPTLCLALDKAARRGLPQGASTSHLVLSRAILGPALATLSFSDRLFLYGDNISVAVRSRQEAEEAITALRSLLENVPAGPLHIAGTKVYSTHEAIELVKYRLRPVPHRFGSGFRIGPSAKSFSLFEQRVRERSAKRESQSEIEAYRDQWPDAFPLWQVNETTREYLRTATTLSTILGEGAIGPTASSDVAPCRATQRQRP